MMDEERILAVRQRLHAHERRMHELMETLPVNSASELSEEMLSVLIECEDLRSELEFLRGESPDDDQHDV